MIHFFFSLQLCGDSTCEGRYHFIGRGTGIGKQLRKEGKKLSISDAWKGFERFSFYSIFEFFFIHPFILLLISNKNRSLTSARIPCTAIKRYPVVARWRTDVDYVAAGIYCFQPYCVTGELEPPANPLICPQFCLRFNDLDNIGLTGRHFSGFVMLGIQVFNTPQKFVFFKDECVDFNLRWLTEELQIPLDEITLVEDVWCGGGNLGPSIEYFVGGLELGNMVFMQYKITNPRTGAYEPLKVQVIDVGIGLERVPWLINGSPTSYIDAFPDTLEFLSKKIGVSYMNPIMEKFGPYSCLLNMDEVTDISKTYEHVCQQIGLKSKEELLEGIKDVRDMYIVADHTRSVLLAIEDGSLPSAVGGAANLRNILRRVFSLLHKNGWWQKFGATEEERMKTLLEIFQMHRVELAKLYGAFEPYNSFADIIAVEYERWRSTDEKSKKLLDTYMKKLKKEMGVDEWINVHKSFGISPDKLVELLGKPLPDNFFSRLAELEDQKVRPPPQVLYETTELKPTEEIYDKDGRTFKFDAKVVAVLDFVKENGERTTEKKIVVLDRTCFYPNAGGQDHDIGVIHIAGEKYDVIDADRVGKCTLHILDRPVSEKVVIGAQVSGEVSAERRTQLRNHHSATHIIYQSARRILGPHVWQHGAKKTVEEAHLDITHYNSLTFEQERAIENEANRAIRADYTITKTWMPKEKAEQTYGYKLYQGGVAPGNMLRVVDIAGFDTEACCGTHCDKTSEVGLIRLIRSHRISDGIVRLHFVAGERALSFMNEESMLLNDLCDLWGVQKSDVISTANRFFAGYKKYSALASKQSQELLQLQIRSFLSDPAQPLLLFESDEQDPTLYISVVKPLAHELKAKGKSVLAVGKEFVWALFCSAVDMEKVKEAVNAAQQESKSSKKKSGKKGIYFLF